MFDDLKQDSAVESADQKNNKQTDSVGEPDMDDVKLPQGPVDDMFDDVDPVAAKGGALQSGKLQSVSSTTDPSTAAIANDLQIEHIAEKDDKTRIKKIAAMIISIMLLAAIATFVYAYFFANKNNDVVPIVEEEVNMEEEPVKVQEDEKVVPEEITKPVEEEIINEEKLDYDGDSLTNLEEEELGTNPLEPDTDNDGVFDWDEVKLYESDPLEPDTDGDELGDYDEIYVWGTDPNDIDTDGDGYGDGVEVNGGYNPFGDGDMEDFVPPEQRGIE